MEKFKVSFEASNQQLKAIGTKHASDTYADIEATFVLGEKWTDMDSVSAVWWNDFTRVATVLDSQGKCVVPHEVLTHKGCVRVNLVGSIVEGDELITRLTSYSAEAVQVNEKIKLTGNETSEITPSQFEQFVAAVISEVEKVTGMTAQAETLPAGSQATARYEDGILYLGIPQGIQGERGETGADGNGIASVVYNADYSLTLVFDNGERFTTPPIRGERGPAGADGRDGTNGRDGADGVTPSLSVGTVTTLPSTEGAYVTRTGTDENPVFDFGIPQGPKGDKGDTGEVSQAEFDEAVSDLKSELFDITGQERYGVELGNVSTLGDSIIYSDSITRVRPVNQTMYQMNAGDVIGLVDFTGKRFYVAGYKNSDGSLFSQGWLTQAYIVPYDCRITFVASAVPEGEITNISDFAFYIERKGENRISILESSFEASTESISLIKSANLGYETKVLLNGYSEDFTTESSVFYSPFWFSHSYNAYGSSSLIKAIKANFIARGELSIGYIDGLIEGGESYDSSKVHVEEVLLITTVGEQTVNLTKPFFVPEGCTLFVARNSDTAIWTYGSKGGMSGNFGILQNGVYRYSGSNIGIDFIAEQGVDAARASEYAEEMLPTVRFLKQNVETSPWIDGYSEQNATSVIPSNAPFILPNNYTGVHFITSIKLNIVRTGTLTIGKVNRDDVAYRQSFDMDNLNIHQVMHITGLGEQTIVLDEPLVVTDSELVFCCARTDTALFTYGSYGNDKGFYYVTSFVYQSDSSLGIMLNESKLISEGELSSSYEGKSLSILGDSISTFSGYIPEGNATYYPSGTVQSVSDTWWYKLYTALGMTLNVNNSWSGSRVTTTAGETSAGCMTRCQSLGENPDVIIVWMGINDFNNEVALGTYDGTTVLPSVTTTFREAYAIMLNKILTKYQSSEVWVCTLPQCERNAETGFPEINGNGVALAEFNKAIRELADAFGVKILDHNKCGLTYQNMPTFNPDNLHPNKYGHSLVANNDIRQMDNVVRTRYSIA